MHKLSTSQFAFAKPTNVELFRDYDGNYHVLLTGATKTAKISFAVAKIEVTGLVEDYASIPPLEDLLRAK